jgi:hypothetical protein
LNCIVLSGFSDHYLVQLAMKEYNGLATYEKLEIPISNVIIKVRNESVDATNRKWNGNVGLRLLVGVPNVDTSIGSISMPNISIYRADSSRATDVEPSVHYVQDETTSDQDWDVISQLATINTNFCISSLKSTSTIPTVQNEGHDEQEMMSWLTHTLESIRSELSEENIENIIRSWHDTSVKSLLQHYSKHHNTLPNTLPTDSGKQQSLKEWQKLVGIALHQSDITPTDLSDITDFLQPSIIDSEDDLSPLIVEWVIRKTVRYYSDYYSSSDETKVWL